MDSLLKFLLKSIVKEEIEFEKKEDADLITYTIRPPKEMAGLVIGKDGKMIKSINKLLKIRAVIERKKVVINIEPIA